MSNLQNTLNEDKEQQIAANLNLYLFQNVWNETYRSLRNNVLPQMVNKRSIKGSVLVYGERVTLPNDEDSFYLYATSRDAVKALLWPKIIEYNWTRVDTLVNSYDILFDVYHIHGKIMHKREIYIRQLPGTRGYLIAINQKMASKILEHEEMDGIRFTTYFDFDMTTQINCTSYYAPADDSVFGVRHSAWSMYQSYLAEPENEYGQKPVVLLFVNGMEIQPVDVLSIPSNSYIDVVIDRNAYFDIEIDLTDPAYNAAFFSTKDNIFKNIVHIPIANNPEKYLMSHNAMELYVRKKTPEADGTIKGLYLHRCADRSVTQITHQDIGVPTYILDAYRDYFEDSEITLRLYWRMHPDVNTVVRDKNYMDLLYQNNPNDLDIINMLAGRHPYSVDLTFWKADHLEASKYTEMIFNVPDIVTPSNMTQYIDALGYYNTMYMLSEHIHSVIVAESYDGAYIYSKPLIYQGNDIAAIAYVDGVKIPASLVTVSNNSETTVVIGIPKTHAPTGSRISIELHRTGQEYMYKITPSVGSSEITFPATEYDLIEEIDVTDGVPTTLYDHTRYKGYRLVTDSAGSIARRITSDGKYQLVFGANVYGKTYYIQPKPRTLHWISSDTKSGMNIQEKLTNDDPLFFALEYPILYEAINNELVFYTGDEKIPVYDTDSMMIYVNNRYLIRDIDYTIIDVPNYDDHMCMKMLIIQNNSYLKSSNDNTLEVYSTSAVDENKEIGYCAPRRTSTTDDTILISGTINDNRTVIYNEGTTIVHVNGYYTEAEVVGNYISKKDKWVRPWEAANPIEIRTSVPYFISDYLNRYHVNDDLATIELLNKYYYDKDLRSVAIEVIHQSHVLYSTYVSSILRDILHSLTPISYDPDVSRLVDQLEKYEYLKDTDVTYTGTVDMNYIDILPHYAKLVAPNVEIYNLLQTIIKLCMPNDPISNKTDVDIEHP